MPAVATDSPDDGSGSAHLRRGPLPGGAPLRSDASLGEPRARGVFGVEGFDCEAADQVLVESLAEGAETSGPGVPVFATAAPASRRLHGRQDYRRQAMASKSVNRTENPPRDATYADFLESNPEPATAVIPRACGRVFGAIAGGEPLNVVVAR